LITKYILYNVDEDSVVALPKKDYESVYISLYWSRILYIPKVFIKNQKNGDVYPTICEENTSKAAVF